MPAAQPKSKTQDVLDRIGHRLSDYGEPLTDLEYRGFLRDLKALLPNASWEECGRVFHDIGFVYLRHGEPGLALDAYRNARKYIPESALFAASEAVVLMDLGRAEDSLGVFREASEKRATEPGFGAFIQANLAEVLHRLGRDDEADEAFESAVRAADMTSSYDLLMLATQAAEIGAEEDAAEFYARYLVLRRGADRGDRPAEMVIQETAGEQQPAVVEKPALAAALKNVMDRWNAPMPAAYQIPSKIVLDTESKAKFCELVGLRAES